MHGLSPGLNVFRLHFETGPWPSMTCKKGACAPSTPPSSFAPASRVLCVYIITAFKLMGEIPYFL